MSDSTPHQLKIRVYAEDTDLQGVVYHANYLRFYERGRTEYFRERNMLLSDSIAKGILYVLRQSNIYYCYPAKLDDHLTVETTIVKAKRCSVKFHQQIRNQEQKVVSRAEIEVVCIDDNAKPQRLPQAVCDYCT